MLIYWSTDELIVGDTWIFSEYIDWDTDWFFLFFWPSMTTIADLNNKWAAYAGPGGWNGKKKDP